MQHLQQAVFARLTALEARHDELVEKSPRDDAGASPDKLTLQNFEDSISAERATADAALAALREGLEQVRRRFWRDTTLVNSDTCPRPTTRSLFAPVLYLER